MSDYGHPFDVTTHEPYKVDPDKSESTVSRWWGLDSKLVTTWLDGHRMVLGAEFREDNRLHTRVVGPPEWAYDSDEHRKTLSLYAYDDIALAPHWQLNLGLRHERRDNGTRFTSPRAALIWESSGSSVRLSTGVAHMQPTPNIESFVFVQPSPIERVRTTELAVEHAPTGATRLLLTAFRSGVSDLISLDSLGHSDRLTFNNTRTVKVHGLEAEAEQRWAGGRRLRVAYGWQKARDPSTDAALTNSPRHLLKLQWSHALPAWGSGQPLHYAVEAIGVGARSTLAGHRLPPYLLTNLVFTQRLGNGVEASLGVYNLFDRRHADPTSYEIRQDALAQDGRTYRLKLSYAF